MTKETAFQILLEQIEGMKKQVAEEKEKTGKVNEKVWGLIRAMMEGALQLHLDLNCQAAAELAAKNAANKNYKLIDRSVAIDALSKIPKEHFDFNTVCNVLRKLDHLDFKTELKLDEFAAQVEEYNEIERSKLNEKDNEAAGEEDPAEDIELITGN